MPFANFQQRVDTRLGQIATQRGQPFIGYRCDSNATGDFPNGWTNLGALNALRFRVPHTKLEVGVERSDVLYNLYLNTNLYKLGDVFVCTDPAFNPGVSYGPGATSIVGSTVQLDAMALAWHMPVHVPIGARLDRRVKVYRPSLAPQYQDDGSQVWNETNDNDMPLVLQNGLYYFDDPGACSASFVPCGLMSVTRRSDYPFEKAPGILRSLAWMGYLPPLPGYEMSEGDAIVTEDGARYVILGSFNQQVGLAGTQMIMDRKISQDA